MTSPLVSICCITYNHAPFIRKCLDGFLMQLPPSCVSQDAKQSDWCEILIHDDASTDGTDAIIREYADKYPGLIFPLYEQENQYSKVGAGGIDMFNYRRARGKYIAYCEGDDWWTIPDKLQRQVDWMETHPTYSVCWHLARVYETDTQILRPLHYDFDKPMDVDEDISPEYFLRSSVGQPLSMVYRRGMYDLDWRNHYTNYCDTIEEFHLLRVGKGRLMKFIGGQYNLQSGGVSATKQEVDRSIETCVDYVEMYIYTHESILKPYITKTYLWCNQLCNQYQKQGEWERVMELLHRVSVVLWLRIRLSIIKRKVRHICR